MKTILVLTDFTKKADHAAEFAMSIAAKANASIMLYNSFPASQVFPSEAGVFPYYEDFSEIRKINNLRLKSLADDLKKKFSADGGGSPVIHVKSDPGNLAENVNNLMENESIWMIVMGDKSKDLAISRFLFGSDSQAVIDKANCPILLIPQNAELKVFKKIIFGTELQNSEHKAILFLAKLAEFWEAQITVLHVSMKKLTHVEEAEHQKYYEKLISGIGYSDINYLGVKGDDTKETLAKFAVHEVIDLITLVHKHRSPIGQLLHGSISKEMMNYHQVPLLVLHKD